MLKILDKILLSDNVIQKFYDEYEKEDFKKWIVSFLPEVEDCLNCEQDNPWHIYNVLNHILHSVEEMNKMTMDKKEQQRRMLAYTMFFHDIAKPMCKFRRFSKSHKKYVDSFFNHATKGADIVMRVIDKLNFTKKEQKTIIMLVKEHDKFINLTLNKEKSNQRLLTVSYVKEQIKLYDNNYGNGKEFLNYLLLVSLADNKAQNPELANERIELLGVLQAMLNDN